MRSEPTNEPAQGAAVPDRNSHALSVSRPCRNGSAADRVAAGRTAVTAPDRTSVHRARLSLGGSMTRLGVIPMALALVALVIAATLVYLLAAPAAEYDVPPTSRGSSVPSVSMPEPFVP